MKKLSLLLASIGAGLLLVGGTVAAYIVSSADTLGVRVSPGSLSEDDTGHITLSWGEKSVQNVSDLAIGETKEVGYVTLASASTDVEAATLAAYTGTFKISLQNLSAVTTDDLLDYLTVKAYKWEGSAYSETPAITVNRDDTTHTEGTNTGVGKFLIKVTLDSDATACYDVISNQIVYLSLDWGPKSGDSASENIGTVNFLNVDDWDHVYFYAYKDAYVNKTFPGEEMEKAYTSAGGDVYSVSFDTSKYTNYIFSDGTHTHEYRNTPSAAQIALIKGHDDQCYFPGEETVWGVKPAKQLATYYVRGSIGGVNYWGANEDSLAMTQSEGNQYSLRNVTLTAGDEIKVYKPGETEHWYGPNDNWVITQTGKYDIHVNETKEDGDGWTNKMIAVNVSYTAVADGDPIQMYDFFGSTSGVEAEYKGTITVAATSALTIKKLGENVEYSVDAGEGNQLSAGKQLNAGTYDIYLKYNESAYSVYCATHA